MANDTMYSSHTVCVNSCAKTFMSNFCMPTDFVRDVSHLRITIFCKLHFSYTTSFSHIIKILYQDWTVYVFR